MGEPSIMDLKYKIRHPVPICEARYYSDCRLGPRWCRRRVGSDQWSSLLLRSERGMRRRSFDLRRPARRRSNGSSVWVWLVGAGLGVSVLLLLVLLCREKLSSRAAPPSVAQNFDRSNTSEGMNVSGDVLCPYSCTRQMMDQIYIAKALVVVSEGSSSNAQFAAELSAQIQKSQALLTRASTLTIAECEMSIRDMALLLHKAQQFHYDSATLIMKMKGQFQSLDEEMKSEAEKSIKYEQIAAEELPKGLFCLSIRLTIQWFINSNLKRELAGGRQITEKLRDNSLYHYCVFSDNILAVSVVVNSTTMNSDHPDKVVFHLVTDEVNYAPMRAWFSMNNFLGATIEVQMVEDFSWLNVSYVPVLKQLQNFNFSETGDNNRTPNKFRNPTYVSMLKHLRFYIPEVYPALEKIMFLDDDVVVQRDLSELFSINLNGNVMGAVDTCRETFHGFHIYLNYSHPLIRVHFDPDACGWAFGMNVFDLREWRRRNVTEVYHYWQERNADHTLWKLGTLPPGLLTFHGLVENLDAEWHVLGLGHTDVDPQQIEKGAVLHYNGRRKPWMKIGMDQYKGLWEKYVDYSHPMLQQCFMRGYSKERLM